MRNVTSEFIIDLMDELERAEKNHAPLHSLHEGYAVILEELDELWEETRKKLRERSKSKIRVELIQIAAMAWRCAVTWESKTGGYFNERDRASEGIQAGAGSLFLDDGRLVLPD